MPHLLKIRKGWENENLARFILSKFSFISQPSTIADDLGADFFCTFFVKDEKEKKTKNNRIIKNIFIYPKHSFAIQIKSNKRTFKVTQKLEFLDKLEIPFFIGVVNQDKLSMTIYSGDMIPELFSLVGLPPTNNDKIIVKAKLLENREKHGQQPRQQEYIIPFFKIGEIIASENEDKLRKFVEDFSRLCLIYHKNIISKKNQQYIFHNAVTLETKIIFGSGSYRVCRKNFKERLAEVFYNLAWAAPNCRDKEKLMQEYNLYKNLYLEIKKFYGEDSLLEKSYQTLEEALKKYNHGLHTDALRFAARAGKPER